MLTKVKLKDEMKTTTLSQFELETFSDCSERKEVVRMKESATNSAGNDFQTGLEKMLRFHRFSKGENRGDYRDDK